MKNWKNLSRRGLALALAFVLCLGMVQFAAFAEEGDPVLYCGMEEHSHGDQCPTEQVLTCSETRHAHLDACVTEAVEPCADAHHTDECEEDCEAQHEHGPDCVTVAVEPCADPHHTDECYTTQYACGLEEHQHGGACYEKPASVDPEDPDVPVCSCTVKCGDEGDASCPVCKDDPEVCGFEEAPVCSCTVKCGEDTETGCSVCAEDKSSCTGEEPAGPSAAVEAFLAAADEACEFVDGLTVETVKASETEANDKIADARKAYDVLTEEQQTAEGVAYAQAQLKQAETKLAELKKQADSDKVPVSTLDELNAAIELAKTSGKHIVIVLDADIVGDVLIPWNWYAAATLDLNGHTLTGTGTDPVIFIRSGTLTLTDTSPSGGGKVTGGGGCLGTYAEYISSINGGGVYNQGTFNMMGGAICGNEVSRTLCQDSYGKYHSLDYWKGKFLGGGVYNQGTFNMMGGEISGNLAGTSTSAGGRTAYGGGVYNVVGKTFTMTGGTISGNTVKIENGQCETSVSDRGCYGGGVCNYGTFTLIGGTISGNTVEHNYNGDKGPAYSCGGGVYNGGTGSFTMEGGTISGNTSRCEGVKGTSKNSNAQGAGVDNDGTFRMSGGTIAGNTISLNNNGNFEGFGIGVYNGVACTFEMAGGEISGNYTESKRVNGGGVYNYGSFTMTNGSIENNKMPVDSNANYGLGGGVYSINRLPDDNSGVKGSFTLWDGVIRSNQAKYGINVCNSGASASFTMHGGTISGGVGEGCAVENKRFGTEQKAGTLEMHGGTITDNAGGGVNNDIGGTFTMYNGTISRNGTGSGIGGVFSAGTFTMEGGAITGNTGSDGGGVRIGDIAKSTFTMKGGTISNNTATHYGGGGVCVYAGEGHESTFEMAGGEIINNQAPAATCGGGGVYIHGNGTFIMSKGTISGNTSRRGGGVYLGCNSYGGSNWQVGSVFTMNGGAITGNHASYDGAYNANNAHWGLGGGVYVSTGDFTMTGGTLCNNDAAWGGDDIYNRRAAVSGVTGSGGGTITLCATGEDWKLASDGIDIDGWYYDGQENNTATNRWSVEGYYAVYAPEAGDTEIMALKAAHAPMPTMQIAYAYTYRLDEAVAKTGAIPAGEAVVAAAGTASPETGKDSFTLDGETDARSFTLTGGTVKYDGAAVAGAEFANGAVSFTASETDKPYLVTFTYEADEYTYVLKFDANGGAKPAGKLEDMREVDGADGYTFTIPADEPTRTGYTFAGWAESADSTTRVADTCKVDFAEGGIENRTKTLYAIWTRDPVKVILDRTYRYTLDGAAQDVPQPETGNFSVAAEDGAVAIDITGYATHEGKTYVLTGAALDGEAVEPEDGVIGFPVEPGGEYAVKLTYELAETTPTPTPGPGPGPGPNPGPVDPDPVVDIDEPDVPLAGALAGEPAVEINDPDVPLAGEPEIEIEIEDPDVPLADVPRTGDNSGIWSVLALMSGAGLVWLTLEDKKRKNNGK